MVFNKNENLVMATDGAENVVENSETKRNKILEILSSAEKLRDSVADIVAAVNPRLAWKIMTSTIKEHPLETVGGVVAGIGAGMGIAQALEEPIQPNIEAVHEPTETEKGYIQSIEDAKKVIDNANKTKAE